MSDASVCYHHPDDEQFSLDYVADSRQTLDERLESYDESVETAVETHELDETVFAVYVRSGPIGTVDNLDYDLLDAFRTIEEPTRTIVSAYLDVFEGVAEQKRLEEGVPLDAYKPLEIEAVPDALERIDWGGPVERVGGELVSNLILRHALPNANHRTAFGLLELYLKSADSEFEMPSMATDDYEWLSWVDPFIVDSKRLTTVRRNVGLFRYLQQVGCTTVERKGGVEIELSQYDFNLRYREALTVYAERHKERSSSFVETLLKQTGRGGLVGQSSNTKETFADWLREKDN
jgi:hypothetical protein